MSRVIAALTETGYSPIADSLYKFIQLEGSLPEEDEIIDLFKSSTDLVDYGHKVNRLFIEYVRGILLHSIPTHSYEKATQLLRIEESFNDEDSSKDSFKISFAGITHQDPSSDELDVFQEVIRNYNLNYLQGSVSVANTYTLSVPPNAVTRIKEIDNYGICEPIVDYSCGTTNTHIIEMSYIRERAESAGEWSDSREYYDGIWKIISDYIPNFMDIKVHKPDFLVLYVSHVD